MSMQLHYVNVIALIQRTHDCTDGSQLMFLPTRVGGDELFYVSDE
jgi:hypothetical protein